LAGIKYLPLLVWTRQEKWVWEQVSQGEIADFNNAEGYGGKLSPKEPEGWKENRILRPKFLETILLQESYRNALTHHGVRIVGAWFKEPVDLSDATIPSQLWLDSSRFELDVDLKCLKSPSCLSLEGSVFVCPLDLQLCKIEGQLNMSNSTFSGTLNMNGMEVKSHLFMRDKARFADVDLRGAKIEGQLDMSSSTFSGTLNMNGMEVKSHLFMRDTYVEKKILLTFTKIQGGLDISGAVLSFLDLTGTKVVQEFRLGSGSHPRVKWTGNSELILRNTEVGNLQDVSQSWPNRLKLQLDGFVYQRLGGFSGDDTTDMATRKISWLKKWLGKQKNYSPRPYQQLAKVLRNAGYEKKATAILFEGKKRQQKETETIFPDWLWLVLQRIFIGYGYRNFRVLGWVLILWGLGVLTLHLSRQDVKVVQDVKYWGLCYSLDMLLPIIELHKPNYAIVLDGWVRVYFYVHKIFGYVLASFLIAGLSGLTKR
jgi:hypothetical protein